jgi:hypothetical protein
MCLVCQGPTVDPWDLEQFDALMHDNNSSVMASCKYEIRAMLAQSPPGITSIACIVLLWNRMIDSEFHVQPRWVDCELLVGCEHPLPTALEWSVWSFEGCHESDDQEPCFCICKQRHPHQCRSPRYTGPLHIACWLKSTNMMHRCGTWLAVGRYRSYQQRDLGRRSRAYGGHWRTSTNQALWREF